MGQPRIGLLTPFPAQGPDSQLPDGRFLLLLDRWVLPGCSTPKGQKRGLAQPLPSLTQGISRPPY